MKNYLEALKFMKTASEASNETIALLINHQLTAEQIQFILEGKEELLTKENLDLLEKGLLEACVLPIERLNRQLIQVLNNRSSNLTSRPLHT